MKCRDGQVPPASHAQEEPQVGHCSNRDCLRTSLHEIVVGGAICVLFIARLSKISGAVAGSSEMCSIPRNASSHLDAAYGLWRSSAVVLQWYM